MNFDVDQIDKTKPIYLYGILAEVYQDDKFGHMDVIDGQIDHNTEIQAKRALINAVNKKGMNVRATKTYSVNGIPVTNLRNFK